MMQSEAFLDYVVKNLVEFPEQIHIEKTLDERGILLTLTVAAADMGKVIGRSGQTAKAIRTLLRVVGSKEDAHVSLKINEPEGSDRAPDYKSDKDTFGI